ncbi:cytochrome b5 [Aspergillus heteromorphus CBS 117.55]|uniref:Cytochrome b5 n=1 Tax=Aspergillus heteromorphus CBS 117.55 TaxID=1448321 RepID=A0A317WV83_9EURO|nr:cytochrome b5 [Aspergillus heteromorphus CBS 117.55]PWY89985.1 cytochrome b5 [Aspergillus heteromorphus CBS 117.55]
MSEVRQRQKPAKGGNSSSSKSTDKTNKKNASGGGGGVRISLLDIIRVLVTLVIASCGLSFYMTSSESILWGYRPWFTRWPVLMRYVQGPLHLTPAELSLYNGTDPSLPIYLSVNGHIFDVSSNPLTYGPGGHYNFFTGRDATRAFVTGCFKEDLTSDMRGVEEMFIPIDDPEEEKTLSSGERKTRREQDIRLARGKIQKMVAHWENFFRNSKKYFEVGEVVGLKEAEEKEEVRELCLAARQQRTRRDGTGGKKGGKPGI